MLLRVKELFSQRRCCPGYCTEKYAVFLYFVKINGDLIIVLYKKVVLIIIIV